MAVEPESIRNVCLIGHRGSGKTALGEAMLGLASGRQGPAVGNILDYAEEEVERGMTLGMSVAHLEWKGRQVNLLDTPGDGGFIADAFVDGQQTNEVPDGMEEEVEVARLQMLETIAESDDTLLEKYLEGEELTTQEMFEGIRKGIADGLIIPVLVASVEKVIGVDRVLDVIAGSAPSPVDRSRWTTEEGEEVTCDPDGPFAAYVFKTYVDPYAGRLSVLRVVGGRCRSDEALTNPRTGSSERLGGISHLVGKEREPVDEAVAGDIIAVAKLRDTATFDTLSKPEKPVSFEPVELPEPTAAFAVGSKARGEEEKVFEAIRRMVDEDPSLKLERAEATGEDILSGLAQMHVELALERIQHRYGVEVEARPPKVPLMETITGSAQAQGRYKKQTGGRGQFGDARIELSPLPRGSGFE